jgi:hypothetical protein
MIQKYLDHIDRASIRTLSECRRYPAWEALTRQIIQDSPLSSIIQYNFYFCQTTRKPSVLMWILFYSVCWAINEGYLQYEIGSRVHFVHSTSISSIDCVALRTRIVFCSVYEQDEYTTRRRKEKYWYWNWTAQCSVNSFPLFLCNSKGYSARWSDVSYYLKHSTAFQIIEGEWRSK